MFWLHSESEFIYWMKLMTTAAKVFTSCIFMLMFFCSVYWCFKSSVYTKHVQKVPMLLRAAFNPRARRSVVHTACMECIFLFISVLVILCGPGL